MPSGRKYQVAVALHLTAFSQSSQTKQAIAQAIIAAHAGMIITGRSTIGACGLLYNVGVYMLTVDARAVSCVTLGEREDGRLKAQ